MKASTDSLSQSYLASLRRYLEEGSLSSMESAMEMGRQSVSIGLETLDVARMHEMALSTLDLPVGTSAEKGDVTRRAQLFFNEAITPIEKTHRAAVESKAHLHEVSRTLDLRTKDVAESNRELQQEIRVRKTAQSALAGSEVASSLLLGESRLLEGRLQKMARSILSANEAERKKMGHELRDEIAQTLLGINIRLSALKKEVVLQNANLGDEIAATLQAVRESVNTIERLSLEFGMTHD